MRFAPFALAFVLLPGCYLSHGIEEPVDGGVDGPVSCVADRECDDGDRCTTDRCIEGRCAYEPIAFSRHDVYRAATGAPVDVTSDGVRALVLTEALGVEPFDASGPAGDATRVAPSGGDRDWDSAITTNGDDVLVVTMTETTIILQSASTGTRSERIRAGFFVEAAWTGTSFFSFEHDFDTTCTVRELDPSRGFVGDPVSAACSYAPALMGLRLPPSQMPVRTRGEVRLLSLTGGTSLAEWTPSRGARTLTLTADPGLALHSFTAREVDGVLGAAWVRIDEGRTTVVAAVVEDAGERLVPIATPIEHPTTEETSAYAMWMSASDCSHRFVMVAADNEGVDVLELDRRGESVSAWRTLGRFSLAGRISSACIDGGVVITERDAVHVLTCDP